jgi:hypothetical protein
MMLGQGSSLDLKANGPDGTIQRQGVESQPMRGFVPGILITLKDLSRNSSIETDRLKKHR